MPIGKLILCGLIGLVSAGCLPASWPLEVKEKFDQAHEAILAKDTAYFRNNFLPEATKDIDFDQTMTKVWGLVPDGKFIDRTSGRFEYSIIFTHGRNGRRGDYTRTYQYQFEKGFVYVIIGVRELGETVYIRQLRLISLKGDLRDAHAFTLSGKPPSSLIFLGLMILTVVLTLAALILIIARRKRLRRPILWAIFVIFGFGLVTLNWTTGKITPQSFHAATEQKIEFSLPKLGLFSAGFVRWSAISPWIFELYFPLGMLLFWVQAMRGKLALKPAWTDKTGEEPEDSEGPPDDGAADGQRP